MQRRPGAVKGMGRQDGARPVWEAEETPPGVGGACRGSRCLQVGGGITGSGGGVSQGSQGEGA